MSEKRDRADMLTLAQVYLDLHRCGLCGHLSLTGYVCYWCHGDDTAPPVPKKRRLSAGRVVEVPNAGD